MWVFDVFKRDVNNLPIINSLDIKIKTLPDLVDDVEIKYKGFEVNQILENQKDNKNFDKAKIISNDINFLENSYKSPPLNVDIEKGFQNDSDYASAITKALENLLGEEYIKDEEVENVNIIQLGSYQNEEDANIHKYILNKNHSSILKKVDFRVLETENNGRVVYRLRGYGLINYFDARELCDYLNNRGEDCLLVKEENE